MVITRCVTNHVATLQLEGSFLYNERKVFQEAVREVCLQGAKHVVIDLSQVIALDSAALGLLMVTHRQLCVERCRMTLARPRPNVKEIIELANLHEIIPMSDNVNLAAMRQTI